MIDRHETITAGYLIGIDIGGTKTAVTLGRESGEILKKKRFETKPHYLDVIDDICDVVNEIREESNSNELGIEAIGISCGGPLDSPKGIIQSPPNLPSWDNVPIVEILEKRLKIRCFLENDANACALAEWQWGNGRGCENLIFLTFGTGLGAGLIIQNKIYHGSTGLAGEVGHIRMSQEGPVCYGKSGSWESFCSGSGISRMYKLEYGIELTAKEICDLVEAGDDKALKIIEKSSFHLGHGLAMLIDVLNPDCIIIGSIYSRSELLFKKNVERIIREEALPLSGGHCKVQTSGLGEMLGDMAAIGVALSALNNSDWDRK